MLLVKVRTVATVFSMLAIALLILSPLLSYAASGKIGSVSYIYPEKVNPGEHYSARFTYEGDGKFLSVDLRGDKYITVTKKETGTFNGKPSVLFFLDVSYKAPVGSYSYLSAKIVAGKNALQIKERNSAILQIYITCHKGSICFN